MHQNHARIPTTSSYDKFNAQNLTIDCALISIYLFHLCMTRLQVIIFNLLSIIFHLILSHGVIFYHIYRLRTSFIPGL